MADSETLSLDEAAARLGVHYMTVYRYVRTGRLPAERRHGRWHVRPSDLRQVAAPPRAGAGAGAGARAGAGGGPGAGPGVDTGARTAARTAADTRAHTATPRMVDRLLAGDAPGAWLIVESALLAGRPQDVYLQVIAPSLRTIGDQWENGRITVADEHRATAVALGLMGRLSPLFARRGRRRSASVLLAGAETDPHLIPILMVGDLLRAEGFDVIQLGADVPVEHLVELAARAEPLAVGLSVSTYHALGHAERAAAELRDQVHGVQVFIGGPAVTSEAAARAGGADGWAPDAAGAVELVLRLARGDAA